MDDLRGDLLGFTLTARNRDDGDLASQLGLTRDAAARGIAQHATCQGDNPARRTQ